MSLLDNPCSLLPGRTNLHTLASSVPGPFCFNLDGSPGHSKLPANARCEDCLPDGYKLLGKSTLFGDTGYNQTGGCYMYCSDTCAQFGKEKAAALAASFLEPDEDRSTLGKLPQDVQDGLRAAQATVQAKWDREGAARERERDERRFAAFVRTPTLLE